MSRRLVIVTLLPVLLLSGSTWVAAETIGGCEVGGDAGAVWYQATEVEAPVACTGQLSTTSDVDLYSMEIAQGTSVQYEFTTRPVGGATGAVLTVGSGADLSGTGANTIYCSHNLCTFLDETVLYFRVSFSGSNVEPGNYELAVQAVAAPPGSLYCERPTEGGETYSTATPLVNPGICIGQLTFKRSSDPWALSAIPDEDWYSFSTLPGSSFLISIDAVDYESPGFAPQTLAAELYDPTGLNVTEANCERIDDVRLGNFFSCSRAFGPSGTWRVRLRNVSVYGSDYPLPYLITLAVQTDPVVLADPDPSSPGGTVTACVGTTCHIAVGGAEAGSIRICRTTGLGVCHDEAVVYVLGGTTASGPSEGSYAEWEVWLQLLGGSRLICRFNPEDSRCP